MKRTLPSFLAAALCAGAPATAAAEPAAAPADPPAWRDVRGAGRGAYTVAVLGDTHFDAAPESVYHSHYDESNRWAKVQHEEFRRNGEMWAPGGRCRSLVAAGAKLAAADRAAPPPAAQGRGR